MRDVNPFCSVSEITGLIASKFQGVHLSRAPHALDVFGKSLGRHVPIPPPNTEFNSVLNYGLKMRLAPKLTPII